MDKKHYRYPLSISIIKNISKIFVFLMIILAVYIWVTARRADYESNFDYWGTLVSPLFMGIASLMYACSWSNISIDEQGLLVEFFWSYTKVPWEKIMGINPVGSKRFEISLIRTKNSLTVFHRLFSLFYTFSFEPSLPVHANIEAHKELMKEIRKHI